MGLDPDWRVTVTAREGLSDAGHPAPLVCASLELSPSIRLQGSLGQGPLRVVSSGPWRRNESGWLGVCLSGEGKRCSRVMASQSFSEGQPSSYKLASGKDKLKPVKETYWLTR